MFSLATQTSWKNDAETWESRTEWHRCVAFGKLADFAGNLAKGAHVAVEGELRSHEYQREVAVAATRGILFGSEAGKSASIPSSSSTAPPSANRTTTITRRCRLRASPDHEAIRVYTQVFQQPVTGYDRTFQLELKFE